MGELVATDLKEKIQLPATVYSVPLGSGSVHMALLTPVLLIIRSASPFSATPAVQAHLIVIITFPVVTPPGLTLPMTTFMYFNLRGGVET